MKLTLSKMDFLNYIILDKPDGNLDKSSSNEPFQLIIIFSENPFFNFDQSKSVF